MDFRDKYRIDNVTALRETEKAVLCEIGDENIWVPQSQIDDESEVYQAGDEGTLIVSDWWARQKGLL